MQGFLLGLSSGAVCLAYCAPVLVPYIMGEGQPVGRSGVLLVRFLSGRLLGYLLTGLLAGMSGFLIAAHTPSRGLMFGGAYMALALLLIVYGFFDIGTLCIAGRSGNVIRKAAATVPSLLPVIFGLLTGLALCPPFMLAIASAAESGSMWGGVCFFMMFFLGTTVYFVPLPFIGAFRRVTVFKTVGKLAAGVIGVYYFYLGVIMVHGGIILL